jgi:hypothetical protein
MNKTLARIILLNAVVSFTGCADNRPKTFYWERSNTTQLELYKEDYDCMKTNLEGYSTTRVDGSHGRGDSGMILNKGLYIACMYAKGFKKIDIPNPDFKLKLKNNYN